MRSHLDRDVAAGGRSEGDRVADRQTLVLGEPVADDRTAAGRARRAARSSPSVHSKRYARRDRGRVDAAHHHVRAGRRARSRRERSTRSRTPVASAAASPAPTGTVFQPPCEVITYPAAHLLANCVLGGRRAEALAEHRDERHQRDSDHQRAAVDRGAAWGCAWCSTGPAGRRCRRTAGGAPSTRGERPHQPRRQQRHAGESTNDAGRAVSREAARRRPKVPSTSTAASIASPTANARSRANGPEPAEAGVEPSRTASPVAPASRAAPARGSRSAYDHVPTSSATTHVRVANTVPDSGNAMPSPTISAPSPWRGRANAARPATRRADGEGLGTTERRTCRRDPPSVRSSASSRVRCATVIESVL